MNPSQKFLDPVALKLACGAGTKPILVFGDTMLDAYVEGVVARISPEAPVPVLYNPSEDQFAIGGAGNVAHNLATLKNPVRLVSGFGSKPSGEFDANGAELLGLMNSIGISTDYIVPLDRRTTLKQRMLAGRQQLLRVDKEDTRPLSETEEKRVLAALEQAVDGVSAIVISDYAKGIFTPAIGRALASYATERSIPILADVKFANLNRLSSVSLLKPNLKEAQEFTGIQFTGDLAQVEQMAETLHKRFSCQVVITCGALGMCVHDGQETVQMRGPAREVFDVSGAGDTTLAALAHGLVRGLSLQKAAELATTAAGVAVSRRGVVAVRLDEVEAELRKVIVPKTWGHEEWIVNSDYCGKKLVLHEGHCCSLHYHKIKDETFYIASGRVGFQMNDRRFILQPGDSLLITPGTKHRFYGLELSEIFEFSTHHMEEDSYRDEVSGTFEKSLFDGVPYYKEIER